jgi:hypothetical protein
MVPMSAGLQRTDTAWGANITPGASHDELRQVGEIGAAADQLGAHRGQVGRHHIHRPQRREHPAADQENLLGGAQIPQPVPTETQQPERRVSQASRHLGAHHLPAMSDPISRAARFTAGPK